MLTCTCGKTFATYRQLNGHKSVHSRGEHYAQARAKLRKIRETFLCLHCGKKNAVGNNKSNKFCNNVCQQEFKYKFETIDKIKSGILTASTKRYLFETCGERCSECGQKNIWNNKPLTLQLDHIDGNSDNNDLSNLRILCPNCHTQTETFGSKGKGNRYKKKSKRNTYLQKYKASVV